MADNADLADVYDNRMAEDNKEEGVWSEGNEEEKGGNRRRDGSRRKAPNQYQF